MFFIKSVGDLVHIVYQRQYQDALGPGFIIKKRFSVYIIRCSHVTYIRGKQSKSRFDQFAFVILEQTTIMLFNR